MKASDYRCSKIACARILIVDYRYNKVACSRRNLRIFIPISKKALCNGQADIKKRLQKIVAVKLRSCKNPFDNLK